MSDRFEELELRRRQLLLRSERLRSDLAADQRVVLDALGGIDKAVGTARRFASPVLLAGAAALFLGFFRRGKGRRGRRGGRFGRRQHGEHGAAPVGLAMRGLAWITLARRALTIVSLARAVMAARRGSGSADPHS